MVVRSSSFLITARLATYYTRFWGFSNFTIPPKRTSKLQLTMFDMVCIGVEIGTFIGLAVGRFVFRPKVIMQASGANASIIDLVVQVVYLSAIIIYGTNLFIEFRYRPRLWHMMCMMADFDTMVCVCFRIKTNR